MTSGSSVSGSSTPCTGRGPRRRQVSVAAKAAMLAGAGVVVTGSFLGWVISGTVTRDSYATIRSARNLGVVGGTFWEVLLSVWFAVPLLAAGVVVGLAFARRRPMIASAAITGSTAVAVSGAVLAAPVDHGAGPAVTLTGGALAILGAVAESACGAPARGSPAPGDRHLPPHE